MSSITRGELRIGLGRSDIALLHGRSWPRRSRRVLADSSFVDAFSADDAAARLDQLLTASGCQRLPVRLVLADEWTRSWIVTPPRNASRMADCQAAVAARFQALYGEPLTAWQSVADWHARLPFLASALPQALATALRRVCAERQLVLLEIVPQFVAAWNYWRPALRSGYWFGVLQGSKLTLGAVSAGRLCALRSLPLPPSADAEPAWLWQAVQREALRWMLVAPRGLQVCGVLPAAWSVPGPGDWSCSRLDPEFVSDGHVARAGAAAEAVAQPAVRLAATGWRQ